MLTWRAKIERLHLWFSIMDIIAQHQFRNVSSFLISLQNKPASAPPNYPYFAIKSSTKKVIDCTKHFSLCFVHVNLIFICFRCAKDPTLGFFPLNSTVFGFRYQTFKFVAFSNVIIQCDAIVCLVSEKNAECDRTCNTTSSSGTGRRKRDTYGRDIYRVISTPMTFSQHGDGVLIDRGDGWEVNLGRLYFSFF